MELYRDLSGSGRGVEHEAPPGSQEEVKSPESIYSGF